MEKVHKNRFTKGIQQDIDRALPSEESYIDAENLILTGNATFYALENVRGTTELGTVLASASASAVILGAFNCTFTTSTTPFKGLMVFVKDGADLKIVGYDLDTNTAYQLFTDSGCYGVNDTIEIDGFLFAEGGLDVIYFTDNVNELRKVRCEIASPFVANDLRSEQLSVLRRSPNTVLEASDFPSGGSLLNGSYQFSVRLHNSSTNTYTKWTIPSNPIFVYKKTSPTNAIAGGAADFYIELKLTTPTSEFTLYDKYQLAVVKNTSDVQPTVADLLPLKTRVADSTTGVLDFQFVEYKDTSKIAEIPLSDITVDLAAIETVKTITTKNNRLFGGNVTYANLEYDHPDGLPSVTLPAVETNIPTIGTANDPDYINKRGYFRDEVYRFYAVYFDDKYNLSTPVRLDLNGATGNQITNGDIRFPKRSSSTYSLFNTSSNPRSLYLFMRLQNHPSWARGVYIFRSKRIKNILQQTPLIPAMKIDGIDIGGNYPTRVHSDNGSGGMVGTDVSSPSPMNPLGTILPKNLLHTFRQNFVKNTVDATPTSTGSVKGELTAKSAGEFNSDSFQYIYPQGDYEFKSGQIVNTADIAFTKINYTEENPKSALEPIGNNDSARGFYNFYAVDKEGYYYGPDSVKATTFDRTTSIKNAAPLENFSEGTGFENEFVGSYSNLVTGGITNGKSPNNQKATVLKLSKQRKDTNNNIGLLAFSNNAGTNISTTLLENSDAEQSNLFLTAKGITENSQLVEAFEIVNIEAGLGDDRYGAADTQHELVFTGTSYLFSDSELVTVRTKGLLDIPLSVFGGDCHISLHQFKVNDNHYGLTNIEKIGVGPETISETKLSLLWTNIFFTRYNPTGGAGVSVTCMPKSYNGLDQVVSVVLESERLGFEDIKPYNSVYTVNNFQLTDVSTVSEQGSAFTYSQNPAMSRESDQKFLTLNPTDVSDQFKSRIVYSDQKTYSSLIDGFDIFRTASTLDLDESFGAINKLINNKDNVYSFQDRAIGYLPIDASTITTADANSLAIRSGTVIDTPNYISKQLGSSYLYSVLSVDSGVFFTDTFNKKIGRVSGMEIELISEKGTANLFNGLLDGTSFRTYYDYQNSHFWHVSSEVRLFDDRLGVWVSKFNIPTSALGIYNDDGFYLLSTNSNVKLNSMYTGTYNSILGTTVTPKVTLNINPDYNITKTFDNLILYANTALNTGDILVKSENGDQTLSGLSVDVDYRRGYYQIPTLRGASNARLRGTRMELTLNWKTTDLKQTLSDVLTKYRPSFRVL